MDLVAYLLSFLSYRVVIICLLSVPSTHLLGLYLHDGHHKGTGGLWKYLLFPFTGGNRHLIFQILGWGLWALSALAVLPVFLPFIQTAALPIIPNTHVDVVSGAAAAVSFMGEVFMAKALLVFDSHSPSTKRKALASPQSASAAVIIMGALLAVTGCALLLMLDYLPDVASRVLYCCLSLSCLLISASTTYGLGGFVMFVQGARMKDSMWQFFQPFAGGPAFVATQAISWSMFSATIVLVGLLLKQLVAGVAACVRCWALSVGLLMLATQAMLALSLMTYQGQKTARAIISQLALAKLQAALRLNLPVCLMYLPVHLFFALWVTTFTFLPLQAAAALWAAFLVPYYVLTSMGEPHHTGCRRWDWLCGWMSENLEPSLAAWFGGVTVLRDGSAAPLDPSQRHIFGFHPHGWYPTGAGFLPLMPSFRKLVPGISPITLSASVMFTPPFIKDVICWAGFRQVSKPTFIKALQESGAVMMCPGGQAEMVHSGRAFRPAQREIALHCRHKGFCRLAIEQRAALVPVLALGETLQLRNLWDLPALQQYTYRRLGFPVPYVLAGRWGLSPLPRRTPLVYVVGRAIPPPEVPEPGGQPSQVQVDALHAAYFAELQALFERHKARHPDYVDARLLLVAD